MTHLKIVEEIQDGGRLVTRLRTILRLFFVRKIEPKSSFIGFNLYRHTLFTPLYATRGSFGPGNI